ncbi:lysophospholipid acyltransferase family protein [Selenomonas sp. TAMA-11512]|uniref:lysophospholipid acyltransferase family protein n=1 Tax=Selenomonas sp. TAMA-11512 TaxID=3095337 RepID=UPI003089958D|nr:lysophospholipid acyltransferase family protein [Selenomonas sp. TAMA-11512]
MLYRTLMCLSACLSALPHAFVLFLGRILGNLYYLLIKKQRNRAIAQMMSALQISQDEAEHLVRLSFINLAQNMLEIMCLPKLNKDNFQNYVEMVHLERLRDALAEGHGVVVLTGHIGTWEWLSASLALADIPVTAIAKPQPNEQYTRALNDLRATVGVEIFSRGTSELLAAGRALKAGKILGFLADQDAGPGGAFIDFLGKTASTPMGPAVFSRKFSAPVVPIFIIRQKNGRHKLEVHEPMRYVDTGNADEDLYRFTKEMTQLLERVIRENPTQWIWFQKRWNTPPDARKEKHHVVKTDTK